MKWMSRINRGQTNIDFLVWWKRGLAVSAVLVIASIVSLTTRGLNLGIDFEGGVSWEVRAPRVSVEEARSELESVGEAQAKIQIVGSDILRVQGPESTPEHTVEVRQALADLAGTDVSEVHRGDRTSRHRRFGPSSSLRSRFSSISRFASSGEWP